MSIPTRCACGARFNAKDHLAGKRVRCPKCKQPVVVGPMTSAEVATAPNQTMLIAAIGGGAALVLVVGLTIWLMTSGGSESTNTGSPEVADQSDSSSAAETTSPVVANSTPTATANMATPAGQIPGSATIPNPTGAHPTVATANMTAGAPGLTPGSAPTAGTTSGTATAAIPRAIPTAPPANDPAANGPQVKIRDDNALKMKLCPCPPGKFPYGRGGSEAEITHEFWLGQTEVTEGQWEQLMQSTPWTKWNNAIIGDNYPAGTVSWHDAMAFCEKLTEMERQAGRLGDDLEYRLPTEAEWSYAYYQPTFSPVNGQRLKRKDYAWVKENSGGKLHEAGTKLANVWGIHDLAGSLGEWTLDRFASAKEVDLPVYGGPNPFQWNDVKEGAKALHMVRGGNYAGGTVSFRRMYGTSADSAARNYGFRVALAPPAKPTQVPGSSTDQLWLVLSGLDYDAFDPTAKVHPFSVNWKLAQGRVDPGKKYQAFVHSKAVSKPFLGTIKTFDVDLTGQEGTIEGEVRARDQEGLWVISSIVIGEEEGEGLRNFVSGELEPKKAKSAPTPPAR